MIAIATIDGSLLRVINANSNPGTSETYGLHRLFGFISERVAHDRMKNRARHQSSLRHNEWLCRFSIVPSSGSFKIEPKEHCESVPEGGKWILSTPRGNFSVTPMAAMDHVRLRLDSHPRKDPKWMALLMVLGLGLFFLLALPRTPSETVETPQVLEPLVSVKILPERQKAVVVPQHIADTLPKVAEQLKKGGKGGIAQNLGFLGILGQKDLKSALGGIPSRRENVSPGAGSGGTEGSGGEMLVGLGQGVKRTTVGNTGVAGLGGIGTKGAGGGAGGYGDTLVGSGTGAGVGYGDGKTALSALSQDIVLEGGLDRAVIQATIAKYLHEVRACYEAGLQKNPGLTGLVSMAFEIGPVGKLGFSKVARSTLGSAEVESCIATRMMGWQFPKPLGGVSVKVTYPFLLRPAAS